MSKVSVECSQCGKEFERERGKYNEAIKKGWNQYCSQECLSNARTKTITKECGNPDCNKIVTRKANQAKKSKSGKIFCSKSCAATYNNKRTQKRKPKTRTCNYCGKKYKNKKSKYCSDECKKKALQKYSKNEILEKIRKFYKKHERPPTKREFKSYKAARKRFGTWNKAVKSAGLEPNPVLFAEKHEAKDGHICDSLSEKIIDDWFYANGISHEINVPYPKNKSLTCDFKVKKYFIEFFGLEGEHKRYTELVEKKRNLAKKHNLHLVEIKPKHLFPKPKLNTVLDFLL